MGEFVEGVKVRIESEDGGTHEYVISSKKGVLYILNSLLVKSRRINLTLDELKEIIADERLEFIQKTDDEEKQALKEDLGLFNENEVEQTIRKREYITKLIEQGVEVWSPKHFSHLLDGIANDIGDEKAPSWRTIIRWYKSYSKSGYSIKGLYSNNYKKGNREKRFLEAEIYIKKAIDYYKTKERVSGRAAYEKLEEYIFLANKHSPHSELIPTPCYMTFLNRLAKEPPKEIMEGRQGKAKADLEYGEMSISVPTTRIMERVALDHTKLDLFVLDSKLRLPLGRPWLTLAVDEHSRSLVGIYISFNPPSANVAIKLIMNTIMDKGFINKKYPAIKNKWLCYGKAALYIFDNGKEFWSDDLKQVLAELESNHAFNPVKKPWFKAKAERRFGTINKQFLEKQKGKTFNSIGEREDYDPKENAVVTFEVLIEVVYQWIIDVFQVSPHGKEQIIPNVTWKESEQEYPPVIIEPERLKIILNKSCESKLTKGGLTRDYIRYDSEELAAYRSKIGNCQTKYKVDEDDLGYIYVFNKNTRKYFKVSAVDARNNGLRQCQHEAHKKHAKRQVGSKINYDAIIQARIDMNRRVEDVFEILETSPNVFSVADMSALAKHMGVEQDGNTSVLDSTKNHENMQSHEEHESLDDNLEAFEEKPTQHSDEELDITEWDSI